MTAAQREAAAETNESKWQARHDFFPEDRSREFDEYPTVTARDLRRRVQRPRKVKMLMRDFIDGELLRAGFLGCPD